MDVFLKFLGSTWAYSFSTPFFIKKEELIRVGRTFYVDFNEQELKEKLVKKNITFDETKEGFFIKSWNYENFYY